MAIKVSLINMKGGVGKTTLAVNLAWEWGDGAFVLLVDLDPQFNASQYMLGEHRYRMINNVNAPTVQNIFEKCEAPLDYSLLFPGGLWHYINYSKGYVTHRAYPGVIYRVYTGRMDEYGDSWVDLIPSRLELADTLRHPVQKEHLLAEFISEIEDNYDLILFDCPPTESLFTTAAYLASDYLLVPVKPEFLSIIGLPLLARSMDDFNARFPDRQLQLAGIVFNESDEYIPEAEKSKQTVRQEANRRNWYLFDNEIPFSRSFAKGAREGQPISRTSYARSYRIEEFRAFAHEFQGRIGL